MPANKINNNNNTTLNNNQKSVNDMLDDWLQAKQY